MFPLNKSHIVHPMMVRTKENHVFKRMFSTILTRNNVAEIGRRLIPPAYKAFIAIHFFKSLSNPFSSSKVSRGTMVDPKVYISPSAIATRCSNASAFIRAISPFVSCIRATIKFFTTNFTMFDFASSTSRNMFKVLSKALFGTCFSSPRFCLPSVYFKLFSTNQAEDRNAMRSKNSGAFFGTCFPTTYTRGINVKNLSTNRTNHINTHFSSQPSTATLFSHSVNKTLWSVNPRA